MKRNFDERVRQNYSQNNFFRHEQRYELSSLSLRNFQNWIKAVLISKAGEKIREILEISAISNPSLEPLLRNTTREKLQELFPLNVLDLGCGKGGDLNKWGHLCTKFYVGVDISESSLEEANSRIEAKKKEDPRIGMIIPKFLCYSASDETFLKMPGISEIQYHLVSSQFALHYLFDSEESVEATLRNITKQLLVKGIFVCTVPDACVIVKRARKSAVKDENGNFVMGNDFYSIKLDRLSFPSSQPFGNYYDFYLKDAVGAKRGREIEYVREYLIEPFTFINMAKKHGLSLLESSNFLEFYKENRAKYKGMLRKMVGNAIRAEGEINQQFWEISHLYKIFIFQKTESINNISESIANYSIDNISK